MDVLRAQTAFLSLVLFYGCATPMEMTKQDLQQSTPSEGFVVGSLLVHSQELKGDTSGESGASFPSLKWWSQIFVPKSQYAKDFKYRLSIPPTGDFFDRFLTTTYYAVTSTHAHEKIFMTKLEKGEYRFGHLKVLGANYYSALMYVLLSRQGQQPISGSWSWICHPSCVVPPTSYWKFRMCKARRWK